MPAKTKEIGIVVVIGCCCRFAVVAATAGDAFMDFVFALLTTTAKQKLSAGVGGFFWDGWGALTPGPNNKRKYEDPRLPAPKEAAGRTSPYKQTHVRIHIRNRIAVNFSGDCLLDLAYSHIHPQDCAAKRVRHIHTDTHSSRHTENIEGNL